MSVYNFQQGMTAGAAGAGGFSGNVIDDSVIFNRPDADFTEWTPAATPTSLRAGSCFFWVKLDTVDTTDADTSARHIIMAGTDPYGDRIYFGNQAVANKQYRLTVNLLGNNWYSLDDFRDFTGWSAFYVKWDVDNGTASERLRAWVVDGTSIREITWENSPAITGADCDFNDTQNHHLGSRSDTSGRPFSGYLGQFALIDGTGSTAITDFIEQDTNGNYGPKSDTEIQALTFGNHGVFFKDGTDIQAGTDTSGNSMSITTTNGPAASAVVSDSPTNSEDGVSGNYCTWNSTENSSKTNMSLQDGNLVANGFDSAQRGTLFVSSGKWYAELTISAAMSCYFGISEDTANLNGNPSLDNLDGYLYYSFNGQKIDQAGSGSSYGSSWNTTGKTVGVAVDMDNGAIWFSVDGVWQNSATISEIENGTTTNAAFTGISGNFALVYSNGTNGLGTLNTGQSSFSYTPPTGFNAINSKTIADATPPILEDPTDEFVVALDTETNILSTLATARSGWSDYVDILLNRTTNEVRRWRFSHDSGNEHAQTLTSTYQANATLSGSDNWIGMSLKVDGVANVRAGSVSHTNGADTTVSFTDVGTTRYVVLLFRRDSAVEVPMHHPDLTSGSLLFLTSIAAEAVDADIKNFTSSSFDIDTGEASDTYDYLVIPESDGFIYLGKHTGNANEDGPVSFAGFSPAIWWKKSTFSNGDHYFNAFDLQGYNEATERFTLADGTKSETTANHEMVFLATGAKQRADEVASNGSGVYVDIAIASVPLGGTTSAYQQSRAR